MENRRSKSEIRNQIKEIRDNIDESDREYLNNRLKYCLSKSELINNSKTVLCYVSYKSEADTREFINSLLKDQKKVAVPKVIGDTMIFCLIESLDELKAGRMGIPEPIDGTDEYIPSEHDVMIVPGMSFDERLYRIGYGKGFYDRYMTKYKYVKTIGLAYDFQIVDRIPIDEWDRGLDMILTEKRIIRY